MRGPLVRDRRRHQGGRPRRCCGGDGEHNHKCCPGKVGVDKPSKGHRVDDSSIDMSELGTRDKLGIGGSDKARLTAKKPR